MTREVTMASPRDFAGEPADLVSNMPYSLPRAGPFMAPRTGREFEKIGARANGMSMLGPHRASIDKAPKQDTLERRGGKP
jgi:hypothetical protein